MAEGFRIASGYVTVNVTLDERQAAEAGTKASETVARQIEDSKAIPAAADNAGKSAGEHLGEHAAKSATDKLESAKADFVAVAEDTGRTSGDKYAQEFTDSIIASVLGDGPGASTKSFGEKLGHKLLPDAEKEGEKLGKDLSEGLLSQVGSGLKEGSSSLTSMLSGADSPMVLGIVGASPLIASAVSTAIVAGAGVGLLGLGAVMQRNDPMIKQAFGRLRDDAVGMLTDSSNDLMKPIADGISELDQWIVGLAPEFKEAFTAVAPAIKPLLHDVEAVLGPIFAKLPALGAAFTKLFSDPETMEEFASIGGDVADVLGTIVANGNTLRVGMAALAAAAKIVSTAFNVLLNVSNAIEKPWLFLIDHLTGYSAALDKAGGRTSVFGKNLDPVIEGLRKTADEAALNQDGLNDLAQDMNKTTTTADRLAGALADKLFSSLFSVDHATLSFQESLTNLSDTLKDNGKAIDTHTGTIAMNTKAGQRNREAILSAVQANVQLYDANINSGMSADDAAKAYDANTAALRSQLKAAGYTDAQINGLIGTYGRVPDNVNTTIATKGLADAINDLDDLIRQLNGLPSRKVINVEIDQRTVISGGRGQTAFAEGGIRRAAHGLLIPPSDPGTVLTGEPQTGGEALIPLAGISRSRAMDLAQVVGDAHGFDVVARGGQPKTHGPYIIQVGDRTLMTMFVDAISGNPTVVSAAASEGDRRRGGLVPGFRPQGR